jgi:hypothetical protein
MYRVLVGRPFFGVLVQFQEHMRAHARQQDVSRGLYCLYISHAAASVWLRNVRWLAAGACFHLQHQTVLSEVISPMMCIRLASHELCAFAESFPFRVSSCNGVLVGVCLLNCSTYGPALVLVGQWQHWMHPLLSCRGLLLQDERSALP